MSNPLTIDSRRPAGPGLPRGRRFVLAGALCLLGPPVGATPFDMLDAQQRQEVADRCLPYRYGDAGAGVEAVRDCLVRGSTAVTRPGPSLDEQHALRRLCGTDTGCEARELQALASTDRSALEALPIDERDTVQRACREVQDSDGPVAWTGCLQEAVVALEQEAPLDRRALGFASRRAALSVCTDREPSTYRRCLRETGMPVDTPRTASSAAATTADGVPVPGTAGTASGTDEGATTIGTGLDGGAMDAPAAEPGLRARLQRSFDALDDTGRLLLLAAALLPLLLWLTRRLTDRRRSTAHDDEYGYAMPSDRARHDDDGGGFDPLDDRFGDAPPEASRDSAPWEAPPDQRLSDRPGPTASDPVADRSRLEHEADRLFEDLTPAGASGTRARPAAPPVTTHEPRPAPARTMPPEPVPTAPVSRHDGLDSMSDDRMAAPLDRSDAIEAAIAVGVVESPVLDTADTAEGTVAGAGTDVDTDVGAEGIAMHDDVHPVQAPQVPDEKAGPVSAFGRWLHEQPIEERLVHVVEFFVYWVAYGDKRYDDAVRRALLDDDPALDDGPVRAERAIKRWVLLEDTGAFVDAVRWMASNGDAAQRRQTLELLIALLVTDAVPTPVQNTLLRFLADAFDIGDKGLQALWAESFGASLPPLPRVDRADWWALQDERDLSERDARRVAGYPAAPRHAARLGLPLRGPYEAARIRAASRLAIQRTEPERFEGLGERAQALAARQLERIEQARDALLEESIA